MCIRDSNWEVRLKNKQFWLAIIPAVLLLVQAVAAVFGYTLDLNELGKDVYKRQNFATGLSGCNKPNLEQH